MTLPNAIEQLWNALSDHQSADKTWLTCSKSTFIATLEASRPVDDVVAERISERVMDVMYDSGFEMTERQAAKLSARFYDAAFNALPKQSDGEAK